MTILDHPLVPLTLATDLEVAWVALLGLEASVSQHDHLLLEGRDEPVQAGVVDAGSI
jgi:hypothetical protein